MPFQEQIPPIFGKINPARIQQITLQAIARLLGQLFTPFTLCANLA